ncbi:MAG: response regulator, partial [Gemmatimonadota bacterium]|nr:response regulator [Gemmatimonadota bacterium]
MTQHTILIADDDPEGQQAIGAALAAEGYHIIYASRGDVVVELAASLRPDVVLLDVRMPGASGLDVCTGLRRHPVLRDVPVVIVSGMGDHESRLRGLEAGADDFIAKPFDALELRARVRHLCRLNRSQRLLQERERYDQLLYLSPDAVLLVDDGLRIQVANPAATRLLSRPGLALKQGAPIGDYVEPAARPALEQRLRALLESGTVGEMVETAVAGPENAVREVEGMAGVVDWDDEPMLQLYLRDVTAARRLAREGAHRNRLEALGQLSAQIAHDFANVLNSLGIYLTLITENQQQGKDSAEIERNAEKVLQRGRTLIRDLLAYGRPRTPATIMVDVAAAADAAARMLSPLLPKRIRFHIQVAADLPQILADPHDVQQALVNLVLNARDAISDNAEGEIEIAMRPAELTPGQRAVEIVVRDSGAGIAPEVQARMFEPFYTTKPEGSGTGLGLAIVDDLVRRVQGTIVVRSQPGIGTTFTLMLPVVPRRMSPA